MKITSIVLYLAVAFAGFPATCALGAPPCLGAKTLPDTAGKRIVLDQDALYFRTGNLQLDLDGSPDAYGIRDQGLENICNGLAPLRPPECRCRINGPCFAACQSSFAAWSRSGTGPESLPEYMVSVGLGGGSCSKPAVRLQAPPRQEWFVSETAVKVARPSGAPAGGWVQSQAAQIDPSRIPYFVIPNRFRQPPWDATPGDAGIVLDATTGRSAAFVICDTGGALDEASLALHTALRGGTFSSTKERTSALGEKVRSYTSGTSGDFRIAIFRHTSTRMGKSLTLKLTADELGPWMETTARARLQPIGLDRLRACTQ